MTMNVKKRTCLRVANSHYKNTTKIKYGSAVLVKLEKIGLQL